MLSKNNLILIIIYENLMCFQQKKYNIVTSIALLSIISLNPTISYSKEIQNQNFFSKLFSKISPQPNQSVNLCDIGRGGF